MNVVSVRHIKNYLLEITFSDYKVKQVDLKDFLMSASNPMTTAFRDVDLFKKVTIEHGNLSWNGEMDLSAESLYNWKESKRGRKPLEDKKHMLRIFVPKSVVLANGGEEASKDKCVQMLSKSK